MDKFPTLYPAVPAIQYPPRPTACTSRIRPPVPVVAPLNGATPVGKLCVSAVKIKWESVFIFFKGQAVPAWIGLRDWWEYPLMALERDEAYLIEENLL